MILYIDLRNRIVGGAMYPGPKSSLHINLATKLARVVNDRDANVTLETGDLLTAINYWVSNNLNNATPDEKMELISVLRNGLEKDLQSWLRIFGQTNE